MRDIAINQKYDLATKNHDKILKWKKEEIQNKNKERYDKYLEKNSKIKDKTKEENRALNRKLKK